MPETFDGYHVWLGIPPSEQPPTHYRLLGITQFEADLDVIDHAADRQMAHVRTFQSGRHAALSQQLLNELSAARLTLLNPEKKATYDEQLRQKMTARPILAPLPKAVPLGQSKAAAAPVAKAIVKAVPPPAPRPVESILEGDLERIAPVDATISRRLGRAKRRSYGGPSWQNAAILGTLAGVLVIGSFLLYSMLKDLDASSLWKNMTQPPAPQPSVERSMPTPSGPAAPAPAAPSAAPADADRGKE